MIPYPKIDPEILKVGPLAVRWYGLMYLAGFAASFLLVRSRIKKKALPLGKEFLETLYTGLVIGLLLGARFGYVLFYNLPFYLENPLDVFAVWHGGMSFHGGMIGSILAGYWVCRKAGVDFWQITDLVVVTVPIGLGLGRLANFINGELFGRVTDLPWAMIFPDGGPLPRHPSQLYEFLLEGVLLFTILWTVKDRTSRTGVLSSLFLILYGLFRFTVELVREPDVQVGYILGFLTMGQILSAAMILLGLGLMYLRKRA
ncbi:MAG: prolipoprotein diacylglyceryl transferase [Thermodesulfovibrionales bacterium]|jgi:phosphatidylglycerol:prolipoprotein diacylglycerol transferase